jgi:hypothetical protein
LESLIVELEQLVRASVNTGTNDPEGIGVASKASRRKGRKG